MSNKITLLLGDCYKELEKLPDKSVDLIVTDPPYEITIQGGGALGTKYKEHFSQLNKLTHGVTNELLDMLVDKMKKINIYIYCNKIQVPKYLKYFVEQRKVFFDILTWHKTNPIPTVNNKYLTDTEYILFFREKGVKVYGDYTTKKTYYLTPLNTKDKKLYNHPTVKPVDQISNFIINSSNKGELVLDPFMGSGTVGVACSRLDRKFIGIEIDEQYFKTADDRIATEGMCW